MELENGLSLCDLSYDELLSLYRTDLVHRESLLAECRRRRELTLVIGDPSETMQLVLNCFLTECNLLYEEPLKLLRKVDRDAKRASLERLKETALYSYWIYEDTVAEWTSKFTGITSLAIILRKEASSMALLEVARLLGHYAHQLNSLYLCFLYLDPLDKGLLCPIPAEQTSALIGAINSFTSLRRLQLHLYNPLHLPEGAWALNLPILSRLTEFTFSSQDSADLVIESLNRYGAANPRLQLQYGNADIARDVPVLLTLAPSLTARTNHLWRVFTKPLEMSSLVAFFGHFHSLRSCRVESTEECLYRDILSALTPLHSLLYLELSLRSHPRPLDLIPRDPRPLPVLHTVQVLLLRVHAPSHDVLQPFQLGAVFPALERLYLELIRDDDSPGCRSCYYDDYRTISPNSFHNCTVKMLTAIRQSCPKLRKIRLPHLASWNRPDDPSISSEKT